MNHGQTQGVEGGGGEAGDPSRNNHKCLYEKNSGVLRLPIYNC